MPSASTRGVVASSPSSLACWGSWRCADARRSENHQADAADEHADGDQHNQRHEDFADGTVGELDKRARADGSASQHAEGYRRGYHRVNVTALEVDACAGG